MPGRPQQQAYARPGGYGSGFYANAPRSYASPQQSSPGQYGRAAASTYQRNDFAQRSFAEPRSSSGGSNLFGGGHGAQSYHTSYHAPKAFKAPNAPKAPKMSGGGHHGGGGHGGGHHGR
jgi:hypothetical protein